MEGKKTVELKKLIPSKLALVLHSLPIVLTAIMILCMPFVVAQDPMSRFPFGMLMLIAGVFALIHIYQGHLYRAIENTLIGHTVWGYHHQNGHFEMKCQPPLVRDRQWLELQHRNPSSGVLRFDPLRHPEFYLSYCKGSVIELAIGGCWRKSWIGGYASNGIFISFTDYTVEFVRINQSGDPIVRLRDSVNHELTITVEEALIWADRHPRGIINGLAHGASSARVSMSILPKSMAMTRSLLDLIDEQLKDRNAARSPHAQALRLKVEKVVGEFLSGLSTIKDETLVVPLHLAQNLLDRRRGQQESCYEHGIAHINAEGFEIPANATKAKRKAGTIKAAAQTTK